MENCKTKKTSIRAEVTRISAGSNDYVEDLSVLSRRAVDSLSDGGKKRKDVGTIWSVRTLASLPT